MTDKVVRVQVPPPTPYSLVAVSGRLSQHLIFSRCLIADHRAHCLTVTLSRGSGGSVDIVSAPSPTVNSVPSVRVESRHTDISLVV